MKIFKKLLLAITIIGAGLFNTYNYVGDSKQFNFSLASLITLPNATAEQNPVKVSLHTEYLGNSGTEDYWIGGSQMTSENVMDNASASYTQSGGVTYTAGTQTVTLSTTQQYQSNSGTLSKTEYRCSWSFSGTCNRAGERDVYRLRS